MNETYTHFLVYYVQLAKHEIDAVCKHEIEVNGVIITKVQEQDHDNPLTCHPGPATSSTQPPASHQSNHLRPINSTTSTLDLNTIQAYIR